MTDCENEFPASWFKKAKLSPERQNAKLNFFKVNAKPKQRLASLIEEIGKEKFLKEVQPENP